MNVNVIVLNVFRDHRAAEIGDRSKGRDEFLDRAASRSYTSAPEQVIELVPQEGSWVGKDSTRPSRPALYGEACEQKALYASPGVATYDQAGKVRYSSLDKGLRVNITA